MFKLYKKVKSDLYDFTDYCGAITLRSSLDEISEELDIEISAKFLSESDIINLYDDEKKIFEGVVVTTGKDQFRTQATAFDFGWYLNKNEEVYQFNNPISECIKKICTQFAITVGNIANIPIVYKKISRGALSDIIKELLEYATKMNGIKYVSHMRDGKFYIEAQSNATVVYNSDVFGVNVDITTLFENTTVTRSVENLINRVKVTQDSENSIKVLATKQDQPSILKYGQIQKLETLSKEENKNALNVAASQLKLLNKVAENFSITLPGVIDCRAGKVLQFDDDIIPIKGVYRIKQCNHNINSTDYLMELELEVI